MSTDPETAKDSDNAASHDAMKDIWDSVTEGTFDHLNIEIDVFFIVVFLVIGCFFVCFVYPAAVGMLDSATKFELTPEMQKELKELMEKKKRGELGTKSELLDQMMAHQEKRDAHEDKLTKIKNEKAGQASKPAGQKKEPVRSNVALRQRVGAKPSKAQADVD